jgi:hypothetical protein
VEFGAQHDWLRQADLRRTHGIGMYYCFAVN